MRVHRARSGRTPMPGVAPGVTERARVLVQSAYEAIASCENKMFGEMYAEALRRRVYENDPYLFNFMKSLEQAPVGIEEFLDSPEFLGATDIVLWPEVRKAVIEINKNWWKGPASAYSQALLLGATGSGKTEIAKTTTLYQLYLLSCVSTPQALYGLPQSTSIVFAIMAAKPHVTKKVIYMPLRKAVETIPYFQKHLRPDRLVESEMIFPSKNIRVTPGGSDADTILGEAIIGGIIDEVNFMNVVLKSKRAEVSTGRAGVYDQAQSIHSAMTRRKKGRFVYRGPQIGVICVSSSTRYKGDFTDKLKLQAIRDKDQTIYIYDKKQYEVRPQDGYCGEKFKVLVGNEVLNDTRILKPDEKVAEGALVLEIPIEYLPDFRTDIFGALRDVCGISTSSISPFYRRPFKIQEAIDRGREAGLESFLEKDNVVLGVDDMPRVKMGHYCQNPSRPRYVHIDLSVTGDSAGIGMARYDGMVDVERANGIVEKLPKVTIELACSIKPDPNNEIQFAEIRAWIKRLKDVYGYPIKAVTYDGIFSTESIQAWRRMGMKTGHLSVDRTSIPCKQFRDALYDGRVDMYEQEVLQREMELLEYNEVTDKVDHLPSECFVGNTEVRMADGSTARMDDLAAGTVTGRVRTWGVNGPTYGDIVSPRLTKMTTDLVDVELDTGVIVRCTPEHPWLLTDGTYKAAKDLTPEDDLQC